jgi:hypothetical protein
MYMKIVKENEWKFKEEHVPPIDFFKTNQIPLSVLFNSLAPSGLSAEG